MIIGYPPFYDDNPFGIYEKILSGKIDWPKNMDPVAKDLVKKLLVLDRTKRLGNMKVRSRTTKKWCHLFHPIFLFIFQNGADDVKKHRWFKNINWTDVLNKKTQVSNFSMT